MSDLHLDLLSLWDKLDSVPEPAPSHRNRTMTAWADAISAVRQRLTDASNRALAMQQEIARLKVQVAAWKGAVQTARLNNPYALDAFMPVTQDDWARLSDLVQRELGHGIDRYSAAMMVAAWDGCTAAIETMATEAIKAAEGD